MIRSMTPELANFTYPKAKTACKAYVDNPSLLSVTDKSIILQALLADLPDYMGLYFAGDFRHDVRAAKRQHSLPPTEFNQRTINKRGPVYDAFMKPEHRYVMRLQGVNRPSDIYALSAAETQSAKSYIAEQPALHDAVAGFQACIKSYLHNQMLSFIDRGWMTVLSVETGEGRSEFEAYFLVFKREAEGMSFMHDLTPILAITLAQEEGGMNEKNLGKALCMAFRYQAFQSEAARKGDITCPFKGQIAHLLSIQLAENEEGGLEVIKGQRPGSLLLSIHERLAQLESAEPKRARAGRESRNFWLRNFTPERD